MRENVTKKNMNFFEKIKSPAWLALPNLLLYGILFIFPIVLIVLFSFQKGNILWPYHFTLEHYYKFFSFEPNIIAFTNTILLALSTTAISALLAYPCVYALRFKVSRSLEYAFLMVLISIFFISVSVRVFGWFIFLLRKGVLNGILTYYFGIPPVEFLYNLPVVLLGMIYNYFPFMLFLVYMDVSSIPEEEILAALDLGGSGWKVFRKIILPRSTGGLLIGCIIVFSVSMGAVLEAHLLGGGNIEVLSGLVSFSFGYAREWDMGSAEALMQVLASLILGVYALRKVGLERLLKVIER